MQIDLAAMFPEGYKISEAAKTALNLNKKEKAKRILVSCGDNRECFMVECIPEESPMESAGEYSEIKLKSDAPGYVLTSLLNIDFENVTRIVKDLKWEINTNEYLDPPSNFNEIYARLLAVSDVFSFYLPDEWEACREELDESAVGVGDAMKTLRGYISFCEQRNLQCSGPFFTFLISMGFFGVLGDDLFVQFEQRISFENLYKGDEELGLNELYEVFTKNLNPDVAGVHAYTFDPAEGPASRLEKIAMISFKDLSDRGKVIRKCQNCGKYFIPAKRIDTLYCDNPSPNAPEMTCKEYGTRRLWYEKQKEDELATLSRKIASAKQMLAKRNPDIPGYAAAYSYFKEQRLIWKKAVKDGEKSRDEYREWLLAMQNQKTL